MGVGALEAALDEAASAEGAVSLDEAEESLLEGESVLVELPRLSLR